MNFLAQNAGSVWWPSRRYLSRSFDATYSA